MQMNTPNENPSQRLKDALDSAENSWLDPPTDEVVGRYLDGTADDVEREIVELAAQQSSAFAQQLESLQHLEAEMSGYDWSALNNRLVKIMSPKASASGRENLFARIGRALCTLTTPVVLQGAVRQHSGTEIWDTNIRTPLRFEDPSVIGSWTISDDHLLLRAESEHWKPGTLLGVEVVTPSGYAAESALAVVQDDWRGGAIDLQVRRPETDTWNLLLHEIDPAAAAEIDPSLAEASVTAAVSSESRAAWRQWIQDQADAAGPGSPFADRIRAALGIPE
jgi:hypothetical protein